MRCLSLLRLLLFLLHGSIMVFGEVVTPKSFGLSQLGLMTLCTSVFFFSFDFLGVCLTFLWSCSSFLLILLLLVAIRLLVSFLLAILADIIIVVVVVPTTIRLDLLN